MPSSPEKFPFPFLKITPAFFLLVASLPLRSQDLPPPDTNSLLMQLDHVSSENRSTSQKRRAEALSQINSAASSGSSAVDFYLQALENTKYRTNHQGFVDWNRQNDRMLHSTPFQNAVLLQLRYLAIALHRDDQHDDYSQVPDFLAYLGGLASAQNALDSSEKLSPDALTFLQQPLSAAEVVQWLQIADLLPDGKSFADSPGGYEEIMEKNVRVPLRDKKDKRLPATWDIQIAVEAASAKEGDDPDLIQTFNKSRVPELLFKKAQDTALIGQPHRSLGEVMLLIQHYPENPSAKDWVEYARGLLTNAATSPVAAAIRESTNSDPLPSTAPRQESSATGASPDPLPVQTNTLPPMTTPFGSLVPPAAATPSQDR